MREAVSQELVRAAVSGDRHSLEAVVCAIQSSMYALALRMLWHPEDARDACQEILIRIITHLDSFRGESSFQTWAYRVAANHLQNIKKSRLEEQNYTFKRFGEELETDLDESFAAETPSLDEQVLIDEVKIGCTLAMLTCLDRTHRLSYILGEILELTHEEAAAVLDVKEATYRKRLSRARTEIIEFTRKRCGLINVSNRCHCRKHVRSAVRSGLVNPGQERFASKVAKDNRATIGAIEQLEEMQRTAAVFRSHPNFKVPEDFSKAVVQLTERIQ